MIKKPIKQVWMEHAAMRWKNVRGSIPQSINLRFLTSGQG